MSAALNARIERYRTKIAALTDTDTRLDAAWALELFEGAANCYEKAAERGPVQYSLGSRSFSFESKMAARQAMDMARQDLDSYLNYSGGMQVVDMGGAQW